MHARRRHLELPPPATTLLFLFVFLSVVGIYGLMVFQVIDFSFTYLFAYFLALFVYIVTLANLKAGLALMVIAMGLSPEYTIGGIENIRTEDFILPVLVLGWITRQIQTRDEFLKSGLGIPILLYFMLALLSTLKNVIYADLSFVEAFLHLFKIMSYFLIFLLVFNNLRTRRDMTSFVWVVVLTSGLVGIYGIFELLSLLQFGGSVRLSGPLGEQGNILGGYFVINILLASGLLLCLQRWPHRILVGSVIAVQMISLGYTLSRTSFVALMVGFLTMGLLVNRKVLVGLIAGLPLLLLTVPSIILERAGTILDVGSNAPPSSWTARLQMWSWAFDRIVEKPLIGGGIASVPLGGMDNEFVKQANDLGLVGLLLYVFILFQIGRIALREVRAGASDNVSRGFIAGFLGAFAATLVHCLGATTLSAIRTAEIFFFATGLVYAMANLRANEENKEALVKSGVLSALPLRAPQARAS